MKRLLPLAASAALLFAACGGDDDESSLDEAVAESPDGGDESGDEAVDASDVTLSEEVGEALDISDECLELYNRYIGAFSSFGTGEGLDGLTEAIASLEEVVPEDLRDDVRVMADAFEQYERAFAEFEGDPSQAFSDPEVAEALEATGTEEFNTASQNISDYFEETCPAG